MTAKEYCKKTEARNNDLIWCFNDGGRLDPLKERASDVIEFLKLGRAEVLSTRTVNDIDFVELNIPKIKSEKIILF